MTPTELAWEIYTVLGDAEVPAGELPYRRKPRGGRLLLGQSRSHRVGHRWT